jgi:hypothetical protein
MTKPTLTKPSDLDNTIGLIEFASQATNEGIEYALRHYYSPAMLRDPKLKELSQKWNDLLDEIENYLVDNGWRK